MVFDFQGIYTYIVSLDVQPPFLIGWFKNHHFLRKGLSSSKRNQHFFNGCVLGVYSWQSKGPDPPQCHVYPTGTKALIRETDG